MRMIISAMAFLCTIIFVHAQDLREDQHLATIVKMDESEQEGIIECNLMYPWNLQDQIKFYDASLLQNGGKVKGKDKTKYDAKDIKGFRLDDKKYESKRYVNNTAVGLGSLGGSYFLEVGAEGPIKLYKYYETPPVVMSGDFEAQYEQLRNNPIILIQKGDDKVKEVRNIDLAKYVDDCPVVYEKFKKGEYGNMGVDEDKTKTGKLLGRVLENGARESYVWDVVKEYNEIMSK